MADERQSLEDLGEFGFIRSITEGCLFAPRKPIQGIGDDCAVIGPYQGGVLLLTTDMLVEDVHFKLSETASRDLGRKAMAVNFSDVAAMGGEPVHALVSVAARGACDLEVLQDIYAGMKDLCREFKVNLIGGDTCASPDRLVLSVTVVGETPAGQVLYRSSARPGDDIYVTGTLGDAAAGLMLAAGRVTAPEGRAVCLLAAHHAPRPQVQAGRALADSGLAGAAIDLSDGLASDLRHICEVSGVGARVHAEAIPVSAELRDLAMDQGLDALHLALCGGEDYELLVTVPSENRRQIEALWQSQNLGPLFRIGEVTGDREIRLVTAGGEEVALKRGGFEHFQGGEGRGSGMLKAQR